MASQTSQSGTGKLDGASASAVAVQSASPAADLPDGFDSASFLAAIVETSHDAIVGLSLNGTVLSWNRAAEALYGYRPEEMIGSPISMIVPEDRREELPQIIDRLVQRKQVERFETLRVRKDGHRVIVSVTVSPIVNRDGAVAGISTIARDVGRRTRTEAAVRDTLARLRAVIDTAVDGIITIDEDGTIEGVNPAIVGIFGYEQNELVGRNISILMPEPYHSAHDTYLANYRRTGERKIIGAGREVRGRRKDGSVFPMELAVSETHLWDRRIFTGIVRDISLRRKTEHALLESEARFRLMADSAPTMIWMSGVEKTCTWFNKRWLEFTGRTMDQELGHGWVEGVHPDDLERCVRTFHSAFDARQPFHMEYRLRRADGEYRWVHDSGVPLHVTDGAFAGYIGSCADITDRKRGEELLRERVAHRTRALSDANEQLRVQMQQRQRIESLLASENRVLELIATGLDLSDTLERLSEEVEDLIPDSHCTIRLSPGVLRVDAPATESVAREAERPARGKDVFGAISEEIMPPLRTERAIFENDGPLTPTQENGTFRLANIRSHWLEPICAVNGSPLGTLAVYSRATGHPDDIALQTSATAARLAGLAIERARSEDRSRDHLAQLAHVARLATMGEMASGLAHELNQPLCAIVNYVEAILELASTNERTTDELRGALAEVARQAQRAGAVIRRLREFVRRRQPQREPIDLNSAVRDVVGLTGPDARRDDVRVRLKLGRRLPRVLADPIQIQQVVVNLVRNGLDAMRDAPPRKRVLTIETLKRQEMVEVAVADCGIGIPADERDRIFDPFFTTKSDGMGMGLSISRSIIEVHDGQIWCQPDRTGGTKFRFTLPSTGRKNSG